MIPQELTEQVQAEVKSLKEVQHQFLQTYAQICIHSGGRQWSKDTAMVFHRVREELIPFMEKEGLDRAAVQALCQWAERSLMSR